jgi:hypothetical protein
MLPLLEAPSEVFFWDLPEFGHPIQFDILHSYETCPLEAHFESREQPKVTQIKREQWLGDDKNVFLGEELLHNKQCVAQCYCNAETTILPPAVSLPPNCIAQRLQNLHIEMTSNTLSMQNELIVQQNINVKTFQELFDCSSYYTSKQDEILNPSISSV